MMPKKLTKDRLIKGYWRGAIRELKAGIWCAIPEVEALDIDPPLLIQRITGCGSKRIWPFTEAITTKRAKPATPKPTNELVNKELWESWVFRGRGQEKYEFGINK